MAANRNRQTWTMRWLVGIGVFVGTEACSVAASDLGWSSLSPQR